MKTFGTTPRLSQEETSKSDSSNATESNTKPNIATDVSKIFASNYPPHSDHQNQNLNQKHPQRPGAAISTPKKIPTANPTSLQDVSSSWTSTPSLLYSMTPDFRSLVKKTKSLGDLRNALFFSPPSTENDTTDAGTTNKSTTAYPSSLHSESPQIGHQSGYVGEEPRSEAANPEVLLQAGEARDQQQRRHEHKHGESTEGSGGLRSWIYRSLSSRKLGTVFTEQPQGKIDEHGREQGRSWDGGDVPEDESESVVGKCVGGVKGSPEVVDGHRIQEDERSASLMFSDKRNIGSVDIDALHRDEAIESDLPSATGTNIPTATPTRVAPAPNGRATQTLSARTPSSLKGVAQKAEPGVEDQVEKYAVQPQGDADAAERNETWTRWWVRRGFNDRDSVAASPSPSSPATRK
ncbi:hypothetical protein HK102_013422 [Quaeritorhiza haematococci]|nr:hypothetical protein HK102_013422 [Quaeritorhiza haematococci]